MIGFKDFINEEIISKFDKDELETAKEMMEIISEGKLYKTPVLYRGMSGLNQHIAQITNDRTGFYGGLSDNTKLIVKNI